MKLLHHFRRITEGWADAFTQSRTSLRACALAGGLLCGVGRRTITRALGFLDKEQVDWSADYRLFSRSPWQGEDLFDPMMIEAIARYADTALLVMAWDDTVVPRTGRHVPGTAWRWDPMSPPFHVNLIRGQRYLLGALVLPLYLQDATSSPRTLPVRFVECPGVRKPGRKAEAAELAQYREQKKKHTLSVCFVEQARKMRRTLDEAGLEGRPLLCALDGSYNNKTVWKAQLERIRILVRTRKDAKLCFPSTEKGRAYARETWTPLSVYEDQNRPWTTVRAFFGGQWRDIRYKEVSSVLWRSAGQNKKLRLIVLAPTPYRVSKNGRKYYRQESFLLSDDLVSEVGVLIQAYLDRYQIEFNHRDEKTVLGVGEAQVWSDKSTPRVPEFIVAAYAALLLAGLAAYGPSRGKEYRELPKWRRKAKRPSCQDLVTLLRQQFSREKDPVSDPEQMILTAAA
jgi:hypothetical protein